MFVVMNDHRANTAGPFLPRTIYDIDDVFAAELIAAGRCVQMPEPPEYVVDLYRRMSDTGTRRVFFWPFVGEFGHEVMSHARIVHFHDAREKVVCCRPGHEVLYPSASAFVTDWTDPLTDAERVATNWRPSLDWGDQLAAYADWPTSDGANGLTPEQQIFAIRPTVPIPFKPNARGLRADVVFGVRRREFCPERNWEHWQELADAATDAGLTFAVIGDRETSHDLAGQLAHSGDFDTDAAIELLQNCRLCVGTDSGSSHLAASVGARMLLFRENLSGSRNLTPRMAIVNPSNVDVIAGGWERPKLVAARMIAATNSGIPENRKTVEVIPNLSTRFQEMRDPKPEAAA